MKIRNRTEVTIHTERILIVRKKKSMPAMPCDICGSRLIKPEQAAIVLGKCTRDIYREIENGVRHFTEIEGDDLLVCCNSL